MNRIPKPSEVFRRPVEPHYEEVSDRDADESTKAALINYQLGNPELPITGYRERIIDAVDSSRVVIITAETGAGKSTQVPQFLAEAGYETVVTEPRIPAARTLSERVRDEIVEAKGPSYAELVGYRTSKESRQDDANMILYVTDGLQQVRELSDHGVGKNQVLILDEVHEWNENIEVLVAWAKRRMQTDPTFKVVVMSATMEAGPLAKYFAGESQVDVPIIDVPGRTYEVTMNEGGDVVAETIRLAREGKNVLVFVPGEAEIKSVIGQLESAGLNGVALLPLYGRLDKSEQSKVFMNGRAKVVVATNVAQTSLTIPDIDAVVDSGLERRKEVINNVEGLYLVPVSQADCKQRAGRAGRTKTGEYFLAQLGNNPMTLLAERSEYGVPEILRTHLDGLVLRLTKNGYNAEEFDFYHNKDNQGRNIREQIVAAKERLTILGALDKAGNVTQIGQAMERLPVESHYARMMVEARTYESEVREQLAAMIAVQESGGIVMHGTKRQPTEKRWKRFMRPDCSDSDMVKQLEVYIKTQTMSKQEMREHDINVRAVERANATFRQLRRAEGLPSEEIDQPSSEQREQLVQSIIAGMLDRLYVREYTTYRDRNGDMRTTNDRTQISSSKLIVGTPFDLQIQTRSGSTVLPLIEGVTNVPSAETLKQIAPDLCETKRGEFCLIPGSQKVGIETNTIFNGQDIGAKTIEQSEPSEERRDWLINNFCMFHWSNQPAVLAATARLAKLQYRTQKVLPRELPMGELGHILRDTVPLSVDSIDGLAPYFPPARLEDFVSAEEQSEILKNSPDEYQGLQLSYGSYGKAFVKGELSDDTLRTLDDAAMSLPDGRPIWIFRGVDVYDLRSVRDRLIDEDIFARRQSYEQQAAMRREEAAVAKQQRLDARALRKLTEGEDVVEKKPPKPDVTQKSLQDLANWFS